MSWGIKEEEEGKIANICQVPIKCLAQDIPHLFDFPLLNTVPVYSLTAQFGHHLALLLPSVGLS